MSLIWMFALVLSGPPSVEAVEAEVPAAKETVEQGQAEARLSTVGADEMREIYRRVIRESARRSSTPMEKVVPRLVAVYRGLEQVDGMSHGEKSRLQKRVKARLEQIQTRLILKARHERSSKRRRLRTQQQSSFRKRNKQGDESFAGPADERRAAQLVSLIQNTIAPETWQSRGGRGSISYYSPLKVLVIRQSGEVHHRVGGALGQLRK